LFFSNLNFFILFYFWKISTANSLLSLFFYLPSSSSLPSSSFRDSLVASWIIQLFFFLGKTLEEKNLVVVFALTELHQVQVSCDVEERTLHHPYLQTNTNE